MNTFIRAAAAAGFVAGSIAGAISSGVAETAGAHSSDRFDLTDWKLTLPTVEDEDDEDDADEIEDLVGYTHADWFYLAPDGAMVFAAPVDGATTKGSRYPRSELREMRDGDEAAWTLREGGTLSVTLKIDAVPIKDEDDEDRPGRIIVGQIHGEDDELIRLYHEGSRVYFENEHAGPDDEELEFTLTNAAGEEPEIGLAERFSYLIDARGDTLSVEVHADGDVYTSVTPINEIWQEDVFYFKAGLYLGVNDDSGTGTGQVSFYALDLSHMPGGGRGGLQ